MNFNRDDLKGLPFTFPTATFRYISASVCHYNCRFVNTRKCVKALNSKNHFYSISEENQEVLFFYLSLRKEIEYSHFSSHFYDTVILSSGHGYQDIPLKDLIIQFPTKTHFLSVEK